MKNVALLTGTINTEIFNNTGNKICDIKERLNQYENSIDIYEIVNFLQLYLAKIVDILLRRENLNV